jgi:hypothetical protein
MAERPQGAKGVVGKFHAPYSCREEIQGNPIFPQWPLSMRFSSAQARSGFSQRPPAAKATIAIIPGTTCSSGTSKHKSEHLRKMSTPRKTELANTRRVSEAPLKSIEGAKSQHHRCPVQARRNPKPLRDLGMKATPPFLLFIKISVSRSYEQ